MILLIIPPEIQSIQRFRLFFTADLRKNPLPATIPTGVIFILFIGGLSYFGARGQAASASGVTPPRFFQVASTTFQHRSNGCVIGNFIGNSVKFK